MIQNSRFISQITCHQATSEKKQLASLENMLRISNRQLDDLHQELQELNAAQITRFTSDGFTDRVKGSGGNSLCLPVVFGRL